MYDQPYPYDDKDVLKIVQYATVCALNYQEATATFLLLTNWMEISTNAFHKTCTDNKDVCTPLGNPKGKSARSNMGKRILVVWNWSGSKLPGRNSLQTTQDLSPAAIWNFYRCRQHTFLALPTKRILLRMAKIWQRLKNYSYHCKILAT